MKITLRLSPDAEPKALEYPEGTAAEQLAKDYQKECPYKIYAARIDRRFALLSEPLTDGCEVVLLDLRDSGAKEVFQNSVLSMLVEGARRVMPEDAEKRTEALVFFGIPFSGPVTVPAR